MDMDKGTLALHLIIESGFRIGLWILFLWLDKITPVIRHIDEDELWMYRYPSVASYVPKRYLYSAMVAIPTIIFFGYWLIYRKERNTFIQIIANFYGLTLAYGINGLITSVVKFSVGRPRPNFYFRCFPEGYGTDIDNCDGEYHGMMDGRKSFPSAHSSFIFTCVIYMILFINNRLDLKKPRFLKGVIITMLTMLLLFAAAVSASRTADYHHHYSDVIAGALLGSSIAYIMHSMYSGELDESYETNILKIVKRE